MVPSPNGELGPPLGPVSLGGGVFFGQPLTAKAINNTPLIRQYHPLARHIFLALPSLMRHIILGAMTTPD